jgi:hypothetical protein
MDTHSPADDHGDSSFCIELDPDSTTVHLDAPADERDQAQQDLAALDTPSALGVDISKKWARGRTLTVCFLGGSTTLQKRVQNYASQWMQFANIKLQFISGTSANIRIAFTGKGGGSSSYVGTGSLSIKIPLPTMHLGLDDTSPPLTVQRATLHEFGHALGCIHEHQQPKSTIVWNKPVVIADHKGIWDPETVKRNIFDKYTPAQVSSSNFDQHSIMLYPIPLRWTLNGFSSQLNTSFSTTDKAFISAMYPFTTKRPLVVPTNPPVVAPSPMSETS